MLRDDVYYLRKIHRIIIIMRSDSDQRELLLESITSASILTWHHVNLHGTYDFSNLLSSNDPDYSLSESWLYQDLLLWFLSVCWDEHAAADATGLLHRRVTQSIRFEERVLVLHQQQPAPQVATQD